MKRDRPGGAVSSGLLAVSVLLGLSCGAPPAERADPAPWRTADEFGAEFVRLALALAEHDPLFLDYRFPGAPTAPAPPPLPEIEARAERLLGAAGQAPRGGEEPRLRYLAASTEALRTRARSLLGERLPPAEELRRIFGLRWTRPEFDLDRLHFRVERSLPGLAPLRVRASRHYRASEVSPEAAREVLREALAACRPAGAAGEAGPGVPGTLEVEWLPARALAETATGATPFYRYRGAGRGVLRLPGDRPLRAAELRRLACHEGNPGHHLQAVVAEARYRETGWPELGIVPLYGPRTAVFEGLAALAEMQAPSSPADTALRSLEPVVLAILFDYLDGQRTRLEALRALDFDALVPDPHALLEHADRFGSYALARPAVDPEFHRALRTVFAADDTGPEASRAMRRAIREGLTRDDLIALAPGSGFP